MWVYLPMDFMKCVGQGWRKNLVKANDNMSINISFNAGSSEGCSSINKNNAQYKAVERDHLTIIANEDA